MKRACSAGIVGCLIVVCSFVTAQGGEPFADGIPRKAWAPKWPGGPIKVLFVAAYSALHDGHELQQRFPIEGVSVATTHYAMHGKLGITGHYWPSLMKTADTVFNDVREGLETDWDVLVLRSPGWGGCPQDIQTSILEAVVNGKTLVTEVGDDIKKGFADSGAPLWEATIDATRFPDAQADDPPKLYRCGDGHVLHFTVNGRGTSHILIGGAGGLGDYEYLAARGGWFLRQAARPQTPAGFASVEVQDGRLKVATADNDAIDGGRLDVAVRRRELFEQPKTFDTYVYETHKAARPDASLAVDLPQLPAGEYQVELRLTNPAGEALDWNAVRFTQTSPVTINAVKVDVKAVAAGAQLNCDLEVKGPADGLNMTVRWYDQWGRLLYEKSHDTLARNFKLVAPRHSLSVINHIQVVLSSDRGPEAVAVGEVLMPQNVRPANDFNVLYWKTGGEGHGTIQNDALRRIGMADAFSNTGKGEGTARGAALSHLRTVPYTTSFHRWGMENLFVNEDDLAKVEETARKTARDQRPYGILAHTLGDENYMSAWRPDGRYLDHPKVWEKFRIFLRTLYPDIEALNDQWETSFADWDAIYFESEKQMLRSLDNPSAWVDMRFFIEAAYAGVHHRMRTAIQEEHPGVMVGFDGAEEYSSYDGYDWWLLAPGMDMLNVYHNYLIPGKYSKKMFNGEAAQSFGPDARMKGCWINNTDLRYGSHYTTWYLLLNGWNSVWWWNATFLHPANGALKWNMQPTTIVEGMARAAREVKQGPATLIAHATKQVDPIAVHYSSANWHGSTIECGNGKHINNLGLSRDKWMAPSLIRDQEQKDLWGTITPKGHYAAASKSFYMLLHDMGYQPRTMARQEIEQDELIKAKIKMLVLPFVVSLSDTEAQKIRAFVEAGGMIVADYRCGLRDMHGRARETGVLDDVFGIKRASPLVTRKRQTVVFNRTDSGLGATLESVFHEAIVADTANSYGFHDDGTPALFIHFREGGVKAIYLNFDLYAYEQMRREGRERDLRETLRYILMSPYGGTGSQIEAPFVVEHEHGHPIDRTTVTRLRDGRTWYYGVLPDFFPYDKSPAAVSLPFPDGRHVYDVRAKRYLGAGGKIVDVLRAGRPKMYAVLPYEVAGVSAQAPTRSKRGDPIDVTIQVEGGAPKPGPHAVRVAVSHPDGVMPEYWPRTIYLPAGEGSYQFTPALNAPTGPWQITVTECVSGRQARAVVKIE